MKYIVLYLIVSIAHGVTAQPYHATSYPLYDDNQQRAVSLVMEGDHGIIYVASEERLYQFTGAKYNRCPLKKNDSGHITGADWDHAQRNVWLGYSKGLIVCYDPYNFDLIHEFVIDGQPEVRTMKIGTDGNLLVAYLRRRDL